MELTDADASEACAALLAFASPSLGPDQLIKVNEDADDGRCAGDDCEGDGDADGDDDWLPQGKVTALMKRALPPGAYISSGAKQAVQLCAAEFVRFVTSEMLDKGRKSATIDPTGNDGVASEDAVHAMLHLGLQPYAKLGSRFMERYREYVTGLVEQVEQESEISPRASMSSPLSNARGVKPASSQRQQEALSKKSLSNPLAFLVPARVYGSPFLAVQPHQVQQSPLEGGSVLAAAAEAAAAAAAAVSSSAATNRMAFQHRQHPHPSPGLLPAPLILPDLQQSPVVCAASSSPQYFALDPTSKRRRIDMASIAVTNSASPLSVSMSPPLIYQPHDIEKASVQVASSLVYANAHPIVESALKLAGSPLHQPSSISMLRVNDAIGVVSPRSAILPTMERSLKGEQVTASNRSRPSEISGPGGRCSPIDAMDEGKNCEGEKVAFSRTRTAMIGKHAGDPCVPGSEKISQDA